MDHFIYLLIYLLKYLLIYLQYSHLISNWPSVFFLQRYPGNIVGDGVGDKVFVASGFRRIWMDRYHPETHKFKNLGEKLSWVKKKVVS